MALNYEHKTGHSAHPRKARTCKYCGKVFTSQEWLGKHRRSVHANEVKRY